MKYIYLFLILFSSLIHGDYLKDLEEQGYCVIPQLFSSEETQLLYRRLWHEYIEKAWPNCKLEDRSNWKEAFPIHNKYGIFAGPAGQTQVMWDLRQDPRIVNIFAKVWNTTDLIVSMDGFSLMCPPEIRETLLMPWPHVDQGHLRRRDGVVHNNCPPSDFVSESSLCTKPYTIQGQFLFEDSFEGDGGFYCIPRSHLLFEEFAPQLPSGQGKYLLEFFNLPICMKQIIAPRGSLILWDSRTVHWNQTGRLDRPYSAFPKVRMVGYLCYVPKSRLTQENKALRKEAFERAISTGHNPAFPELKQSQDHISPKFKHYLEDSSYKQPTLVLTPLGKALLGFDD